MSTKFFPGGLALAAAANLAGFSDTDIFGDVVDCKGTHWNNASTLLVSLAICQAESSGNSFATHTDANGSTDAGPWQISTLHTAWFSANPSLTAAPHWFDFTDNAVMAFELYTDAGNLFSPWSSFNNLDPITHLPPYLSWRDATTNQTRMDWAYASRVALTNALAAGKTLAQIVEINLETSM